MGFSGVKFGCYKVKESGIMGDRGEKKNCFKHLESWTVSKHMFVINYFSCDLFRMIGSYLIQNCIFLQCSYELETIKKTNFVFITELM